MGKKWDASGIAYNVDLWKECLRVLKPGGHLLAFSGTRTYHRMAVAIEDAGFNIRDMIEWIYACLSEDTEVLTTRGFKKYQDIKKDEIIACFDSTTEEIIYNKIKNFFIYDFDGKMVNIKGRTTDQLLTPNHKILIKEKKEKGHRKNKYYETDWLFKEVKNLTPHRGIKLPLAGKFNGTKSIGIEMAELLGWILSEGTINKRNGAIYICQTERYPENINRIRYLLKKTDLFYSETKGTYPYKDKTYTRHDFYIPSKKAEVIKKLIPNKKPTRELLELKRDELEALFNGLIGGDGSINKSSKGTLGAFYQKDINTLDWFQVLCLHLGYKSSQNNKKGSVSWGKKSWMAIDAGWFKKKITQVNYKGKVWCVEVPTGAFVARRNGKIFITGNSGFPKSLNIGKKYDQMRLKRFFKDNPEIKKQYDTAKKELKILNNKYHKELDKHNENNDNADTWDESTYEQTKETIELKEKIDQLEREIRSIEFQGNEREVIGEREVFGTARKVKGKKGIGASYTSAGTGVEFEEHTIIQDTKGNSEWEGFGTALKPAHEPIILARKPLSEKTIVENVLKWGCGGLDIDGCRIPISDSYEKKHLDDIARGQENATNGKFFGGKGKSQASSTDTQGRFPANICVSQRIDIAINDLLEAKSILLDKWQYPSV